ncbi:hypothetical protein U9607_004533 [Vibrio alginolyticus]|uniref:hypothetical protein n=1 Tax=Vibrio TaxID=662 RepID=UPI002AFBC8AE|nr:hypothetical protein [Vibrio alginolyticus]
MSGIVEVILSPFGGVTVVLVALSSFLGHLSTKRIINRELTEHKLKLERYKSESSSALQHQKDMHSKELQHMQQEHAKDMELVQSRLKQEFLKFEAYTSISQSKYQELFVKRIEVYEDLLKLKRDIDESVLDNVEFLEIHDDDPTPFTNAVRQINEASQKNPMVISNELAKLSNELFEQSTVVFSNAKVQALYAEMHNHEHKYVHQFIMEAENEALREMFTKCGDLYRKWFEQLDCDLQKIRSILDLSDAFLGQEH